MARASLPDEIATVAAICRDLGLGDVAPVLLKAAHHTTLLVEPLALVARVQSSGPADLAKLRARREQAVTRYLADRGAPVVTPLEGPLAGPHVTASAVVTLWPYVEGVRGADDSDAAVAATALVAVHRALTDIDCALPPYTHALDRCWGVLTGPSATLSGADRRLLEMHFRRLRDEVEATPAQPVPLHGDVHLGNVLVTPGGGYWTDFEDACVGPREYDLAGLPSSVWPAFGDADQTLIGRMADLKSVCVAIWCAADRSRSDEVREAADYHLQRVRDFAA